MKIDWITRTKAMNRFFDDEADIFISISKPSKGGNCERVRIRFSEGIHSICFNGETRLLVGVAGNRLYFKPTDTKDGYTISTPASAKNIRSICLTSQKLLDYIHSNPTAAQSKLLYDEKQKLYYIEAKGKVA